METKAFPPEILIAAACFLLLLLLRCRRSRGLPTDWPFVGMLPALLGNLHRIHDFAVDVLRRSGCTFLVAGPWLLSMDMLVTADPANVNHVFNAAFANYPKGDEFAEIFDILGGGIFTADDESWALQRKKAHKLVGFQAFRAFVLRRINRKVEEGLLPLLAGIEEKGETVDLQDVFLRLTFDSTCELVFGDDPGCLSPSFPTVPFAKAMDDAMQVILLRHALPSIWWRLLRRLRLGEEGKLIEAWAVIDDFIYGNIEKKKMTMMTRTEAHLDRDGGGGGGGDLLTSYLEDDDFRSDQKFLRDTTLSMMLAGRDTTGSALSWFFWLVSSHPGVEANILDELKSSARPGTNIVDCHDELGRLVYLHAALCEALRLYPPVPFEGKAPLRRDVLPSGHAVRPAMRVMVSLYAMGRMEGIWGKDCEEFRPERWISDKGNQKLIRHEPSYKFMSFNSGARTCLGKDVAFTQMKAVAAAVLSRFAVEVVPSHVVEPKPSIILHMKHGLLVRLRRRAL